MGTVIRHPRFINRGKLISKIGKNILDRVDQYGGCATLAESGLHQLWHQLEEAKIVEEPRFSQINFNFGGEITEALIKLQRDGFLQIYIACDMWRGPYTVSSDLPRNGLRPYEVLLRITGLGKRKVRHEYN